MIKGYELFWLFLSITILFYKRILPVHNATSSGEVQVYHTLPFKFLFKSITEK